MKNKVILSIISCFIIIPFFIVPVNAQTTNIQTTNYGTITYAVDASTSDAENLVINLGPISATVAGKKISTVNYQLDNYYTGTITFQATGPFFSGASGTNNNIELYLVNCTVVERNQDMLTVYIKEQREISISIVRDNSGTININDWYQIYSETLTAAGSELNTLNAILARCVFINDDTLDIAADVRNIRAVLGYENASDVHTDLTSLAAAINSCGTKLDTLNTITGQLTSIQSYVIHADAMLEVIKNNGDQVETLLQSIDNDINGLSNLSWNNISNPLGWTTDFSTYSTAGAYHSNGYYMFDTYGLNYYLFNQDPILKIQVQLNSIGTNIRNYVKPIMLAADNSTVVDLTKYIIYEYYSRGALVYYLKFDETFSGYGNIKFGIQLGNLSRYIYSGNGNQCKYLTHDQDDYYTVLNCISNLKQIAFDDSDIIAAINSVVSAINNMSVNVNNMTVNATGITYNVNNTQVTNSVNNYNTEINQVFTIENNLSADFNTYNQQFNPDFTNALQSIQTAPQVMNGIITSLYDLSFIKYPTLIMLAGIVLLAFLGV